MSDVDNAAKPHDSPTPRSPSTGLLPHVEASTSYTDNDTALRSRPRERSERVCVGEGEFSVSAGQLNPSQVTENRSSGHGHFGYGHPFPYYPHGLHPHYNYNHFAHAMYGIPGMQPTMQPMSGMAGMGFAPVQHNMATGVPGCSSEGATSVRPHLNTDSTSAVQRSRIHHSRSPDRDLSPQGGRRRSSPRLSRSKRRRSPSLGSTSTRRRRGQSSSSQASSPSPRRSFVQKARNHRSVSSSSRSSENDEDSQDEQDFGSLKLRDCKTLVGDLRPDLVSARSHSGKRVLSAGERVLKRKGGDDSLCFAQSSLVTDCLEKLSLKLRDQDEAPATDQPAELTDSCLKTGELLPRAGVFMSAQDNSLLAQGSLPAKRLTLSNSDRSARSRNLSFKPLLKEKGLLSLEDSARRGLQSLSVTDTILGIVVDSLSGKELDKAYTRRPSEYELLQLLDFACKGINHAVDATARCYVNSVLIRRDSFLHEADKLPKDDDRSALRSLPIAAPALIGPQVEKNVERWEKRQFDTSVRSIVSKAAKHRSPSKKRASSTDNRPPFKSGRFQSASSSRSSSASHRPSGRGRFPGHQGKSKPKASAHPQ